MNPPKPKLIDLIAMEYPELLVSYNRAELAELVRVFLKRLAVCAQVREIGNAE